jgi:hypothetical protein
VADYAVSNKLVSEPAFKWWVLYTLKKRDCILSKITTIYLRREQKFGIIIPKSVKEALKIDEDIGTTFWSDAIRKEMGCSIMPAIRILEDDEAPPVGSKQIQSI